jgi:hypothetical protein
MVGLAIALQECPTPLLQSRRKDRPQRFSHRLCEAFAPILCDHLSMRVEIVNTVIQGP